MGPDVGQTVSGRQPLTMAVVGSRQPTPQTAALPYSPVYDDVYHAQAGAWAQARHVFLGGNGLPERWRGRDHFVILETGFGLGNNFLATWAAWRADPARPTRLTFISIEKHPLRLADLQRVHAQRPADGDADEARALAHRLCEHWPPATPGLHPIDFDEPDLPGAPARSGVTLLLALGDIADMLPALMARVDAFYLDGFAPAKNPDMWDEGLLARLDRLAAPGATAATWSAARGVRDGLTRAGFVVDKVPGFGGKRDMTRARFAPHHTPTPAPGGLWPARGSPRRALVIGAGLAGCAAAWALCREGWQVQVIDRHGQVAPEASGNPGGLYHSIVHAQDGPHARAHRAAALQTHAWVAPRVRLGHLSGHCEGLLRLEPRLAPDEAARRLDRLHLPEDHVSWSDTDDAQAQAGVELPSGGWWFRQAGWVHPAGLTRTLLDAAQATGGLAPLRAASVHRIHRTPEGQWQVLTDNGCVIDEAPVLVLAAALGVTDMLGRLTGAPAAAALPLSAVRGQISRLPAGAEGLSLPRVPVAGGGYALPLPDGQLLCGATTQHHDLDPAVRDEDHHHNVQQAQRLGCLPLGDPNRWVAVAEGRTGWRAVTPDRLPCIGAVPRAPGPDDTRWPDQVRRVPRLRDDQGGLYVLTGLGSRGITWSLLAGRLLAHWVTGVPCPIEVDLRDALDPARFHRQRANPHDNARPSTTTSASPP